MAVLPMTPGWHAQRAPDAAAIVMGGTGERVSYAQLDERSARPARALRSRGLREGEHIAIAMENNRAFLEVAGAVYLSPAPLYHSAPLVYSMSLHRLGGTAVVMERFDPRQCLELIERYRVTHAQFVPTMFIRLLRLPRAGRERYDLSSLRLVLHAAAPCPVAVKRQMLDWWGPIIGEYYAGTEDIGNTFITAQGWLAHPGSVGRPAMECHVVGEDGQAPPAPRQPPRATTSM